MKTIYHMALNLMIRASNGMPMNKEEALLYNQVLQTMRKEARLLELSLDEEIREANEDSGSDTSGIAGQDSWA